MDVTDVLRDRMHEPAGLQSMTAVSIAVHAALVAFVLFGPGRWMEHNAPTPPTVMTITLGGGSGPQTGGMTSIGGRPVQTETPPDEPTRREASRPAAAKIPEMTLPTPNARVVKAPNVKQAPEEARGRTPTRGAEVTAGSAVAETGARGQGFGLSSGGAGLGSTLDVADFCCPDYIVLMTDLIRRSWNPTAEVSGQTIIKFTIQRDGRITEPALEKSSGYTALDLNAQRAVTITRQLPPLPAAFSNPTLTVHLNFQYQR
jgi:TonB family protein